MDQIMVLVATIILFPMGYIMKQIEDVDVRELMNLVFGFLIGYMTMGIDGIIHSIITSVGVYLICLWAPRKNVDIYVWSWTLTYITGLYVLRWIYGVPGHLLDITLIQMLMTARLTAFGSNYCHGQEELRNEYWRKYQIQTLPEFKDFLNYVFFYQTYLIGPFVEYQDVKAYLTNKHKINEVEKREVLTSELYSSLILLGSMIWLKMVFPIEYLVTDEFKASTYVYKMVYCYLAMLGFRIKYQFIWVFQFTTLIYSEFAYDPDTLAWTKGKNMDLTFECSSSAREMTQKWNITIANWLRHHCYEKLKPYSPLLAMIITNMLSAFWHGLNIGYYISFGLGSFLIAIGRNWNKKIEPQIYQHFNHPLIIVFYQIICHISLYFSLTFIFIPFAFLSLSQIYSIYASLYFLPLICMIIIWFLTLDFKLPFLY